MPGSPSTIGATSSSSGRARRETPGLASSASVSTARGRKSGRSSGVDSYFTADQTRPSVAIDDAGNFVVAWTSQGGVGEDGSTTGIFAQRFNRSGELLNTNAEFKVNAYTAGFQVGSSVAVDPAGDMVFVWEGEGAADADGVFGRRTILSPGPMQVDAHPADGSSSDADGVLERERDRGRRAILEEPHGRRGCHPSAPPTERDGLQLLRTGPGDLHDRGQLCGRRPGGHRSHLRIATTTPSSTTAISSTSARFATRTQTHWDTYFTETLSTGGVKLWTIHVGNSFTDVPETHPFARKIETLLHNGITVGCSEVAYCPGLPVARDQMAIFIARASPVPASSCRRPGSLGALPYNCSSGGASLFTDVAPTDPVLPACPLPRLPERDARLQRRRSTARPRRSRATRWRRSSPRRSWRRAAATSCR